MTLDCDLKVSRAVEKLHRATHSETELFLRFRFSGVIFGTGTQEYEKGNQQNLAQHASYAEEC